MADWRTGAERALARWDSGDEAGAVLMLAGSIRAAGGHRGPIEALVAAAGAARLEAAERLLIAVAHRHGDARMKADLDALFAANHRLAQRSALRGLEGAAARRFEGEAHLAAGRWVEARLALEALVRLNPTDADAHARLGVATRALGDAESADAHFEAALALAPGHPEAHAELGLSRWRAGDDLAAVPHLEAAHRAMPGQLRLAGLLAESYADADRPEAARAVLATTLRAGAPWTPERLSALAAELLAAPKTYDALFEAVAAVVPEAAEACARRLATRTPVETPLPEPWRALLALPEPQGASLCMIVRDEAANLGRLLDSAAGMADEIIVVDTGSVDDTVAVARAHGARVVEWAWTGDFAAARNESLRHATREWVLRLDADQVVDGASKRAFRRFLQRETHPGGSPAAYLAQLREHLGDGKGPAARGRTLALFANDPALRYTDAVHERLVDATPGRGLRTEPLNDLVIHHTGYAGDNRERHARNVAILERALAERPDDPAVHHGLGQESRAEGDYPGAIAHLERALTLAAPDSGQHAASTMLLAASHLALGDWDAAQSALDAAIAKGLSNADVFGMRGHATLMLGRPAEAIADLARALAYRGAIGAGLLAEGYDGWGSRALLAAAFERSGDTRAAAEAMAAARAEAPSDEALGRRVVAISRALTGHVALAARLLTAAGLAPSAAPQGDAGGGKRGKNGSVVDT